MEILTGEQMRRTDRRAIDELGIPGLELMEAAGRGVARALIEDYPRLAGDGVVVLCGKGNNGGDGLVAARHLLAAGIDPVVILLGAPADLRGDAAHNYRAALDAGIAVRQAMDPAELRPHLVPPRIVLDAMLGTGVKGGASGLVARAIDELRASGCRVVAVDLPSGVDADGSDVAGPAVVAERTYTLCRPKAAFVQPPAANHCGSVRVVPIGIPDDAIGPERGALDWIDLQDARALLPTRPADSHKGTYGHLLAVAGSRGKSGAAVLLARGALRCGVGLITVATGGSSQERVAVQQAELMTEPLPEADDGGLSGDAAGAALALLAARDALAIGPGLGTAGNTAAVIRAILARCESPAVVDADGLNALAAVPPERALPAATRCATVLTPHPGEAARLLRCSVADVQADRLSAARRLAAATGAVVVLKGHRTLVAAPDGRVAVNSTGNAGMATGGTGDVLTGAIGAFLARKLSAWDAARLGVWAHGDAGDRAARAIGREGLIAGDLAAALPAALAALERPA
jgi:NAD(P)H-hydrate epimerase